MFFLCFLWMMHRSCFPSNLTITTSRFGGIFCLSFRQSMREEAFGNMGHGDMGVRHFRRISLLLPDDTRHLCNIDKIMSRKLNFISLKVHLPWTQFANCHLEEN